MRQVDLQKLRIGLSKELNDLPVEVIKRGKVIAVINAPGGKAEEDVVSKTFEKITKDEGFQPLNTKEQVFKKFGMKPAKTNNKPITPFSLCPKHKGSMLMTCGCPQG